MSISDEFLAVEMQNDGDGNKINILQESGRTPQMLLRYLRLITVLLNK